MKKKMFLLIAILAVTISSHSQNKKVILPGKGKLDIEKFDKKIDFKMNISDLSLSELRVLRNALAARQGYIFKSADLYSIYRQTSWYDSLVYKRLIAEEKSNGKYGWQKDGQYKRSQPTYTKEEVEFIRKIESREEQLRNDNRLPKGAIVNVDNIINPYQLENIDKQLFNALGRNGFAIVPNDRLQLFHFYEKNDYYNFPSFVTTDLYLQLFHLYFDSSLSDIEENKLNPIVIKLSQQMFDKMTQIVNDPSAGKRTKATAAYCQAYFAIALALAQDKIPAGITQQYQQTVKEEIKKVNNSENDFSSYLGYTNVEFFYSLFRPRGHYTRSEKIKRYFKAMMWLQTVPFMPDTHDGVQRAALIAKTICTDQKLRNAYNSLFEPMTFLFGEPDNITITQVYELMRPMEQNTEKLFKNEKAMDELAEKITQLAKKQIRILPKIQRTNPYKVNFMPQRYMPDAEVLNEMVDFESKISKRRLPSGLDVFAAIGCTAAERILIDELSENTKWEKFTPTLEKMKTCMGQINWEKTVANKWINSLAEMNHVAPNMPYFMKTKQWEKKNLNTSLASWAELKHDAILYAKQPMGAECGSGEDVPDPVVKGYVEPNIRFWTKAVELITELDKVYKKFNLTTEKTTATTKRVKEMAEFLLRISKKELDPNAPELTDEEYGQIEIIGATFENISLDLVREPNEELSGWNDVSGADKSISVVADVYTANALNNPRHAILYEGVGTAYEIYVVVQIGKDLYLTRGAVLSYREFERPSDEQRMTDEEWQEKLKKNTTLGTPQWMNEIIVPLKILPEENEELFYSSGC